MIRKKPDLKVEGDFVIYFTLHRFIYYENVRVSKSTLTPKRARAVPLRLNLKKSAHVISDTQ